MLEKFRFAKQKEIARLGAMAGDGAFPAPWPGSRPSFTHSIMRPANGEAIAVIAEYKRASPSRGVIRDDLSIEDVAEEYVGGGASALSILTETEYFHGDFDLLERARHVVGPHFPLLRKDFIFDPLQVLATAASPASALLLIVRLTPDAQVLGDLIELGHAHGLESVVEVFDDHDLAIARNSGAKVIQVNARDLSTLQVDRKACLELIRANPPQGHEIWISASGINLPQHLREAAEAGFNAALVGTSLMSAPSPGNALRELFGDVGNVD